MRERYGPFDLRNKPYEETVERNLYLTFEAMRAHLSGPDRLGNLNVTEYEDRLVIAFDPCGSGNRGQRRDAIEGTPSRSEPPYEFGVTHEEHDWAWNESAYCSLTNELWAVEQWNAPVRVVDSPLHPDDTLGDRTKPCTWRFARAFEVAGRGGAPDTGKGPWPATVRDAIEKSPPTTRCAGRLGAPEREAAHACQELC